MVLSLKSAFFLPKFRVFLYKIRFSKLRRWLVSCRMHIKGHGLYPKYPSGSGASCYNIVKATLPGNEWLKLPFIFRCFELLGALSRSRA